MRSLQNYVAMLRPPVSGGWHAVKSLTLREVSQGVFGGSSSIRYVRGVVEGTLWLGF
jgi:hypothetical protein